MDWKIILDGTIQNQFIQFKTLNQVSMK